MVVLDSNTRKEFQVLSIASRVDDTIYAPKSKRLYAIGGGFVDPHGVELLSEPMAIETKLRIRVPNTALLNDCCNRPPRRHFRSRLRLFPVAS
jgi:hypothetical protein